MKWCLFIPKAVPALEQEEENWILVKIILKNPIKPCYVMGMRENEIDGRKASIVSAHQGKHVSFLTELEGWIVSGKEAPKSRNSLMALYSMQNMLKLTQRAKLVCPVK